MTNPRTTPASNGPASRAGRSRIPQADSGLTPPSGNKDPRRRLGDVAVELGFVDRELVEQVMAKEREQHVPVGRSWSRAGSIDSAQLARMLAERNSLDYVDLNEFEVDQGAANLIDAAVARRCRAVPIAFLEDGVLLVATADPSNVLGVDDIALSTGYEVRRAIATPEGIEALMARLTKLSGSVEAIEDDYAAAAKDGRPELLELRASAEDAPVVKLVHSVIADAVNRGASDIHFDPRQGAMQVRYRVDGVMIDTTTVPTSLVPGHGLPDQDHGRARHRRAPDPAGRPGRPHTWTTGTIDIRVSTLPVIRGESVVMRILDKERVVLDLETLGMRDEDRELLLRAVGQTQGAVLATGPTGAGKTTTLYALLNAVNSPEKTLISIEDPVEYEVEGVKQIHVNPTAGLTFASGLRSMVRSDPDTLMVGEIRDRETAQIAMEAALTGHLVLSTLHTNDASLAAARLIDMGVEPFLIASSIECIVAQRLARRLCDSLQEAGEAQHRTSFARWASSEGGAEIYEPVGCATCNDHRLRGPDRPLRGAGA